MMIDDDCPPPLPSLAYKKCILEALFCSVIASLILLPLRA